MAKLKIDRFYDLSCDICGRWWSTDYDGGPGMAPSREYLEKAATKAGWHRSKDKNVCPECYKTMKENGGKTNE